MPGALHGARVIELAEGIAGPYAGQLLAGLGADVLKVEPPEGDVTRRWGPFPNDEPHPERSAHFLYLNCGKRSVTLDTTTGAGRTVLARLVANADIVLCDYAPSEAPKRGADAATLRAVNPQAVSVSITPFGESGPYRDYRADEIVIQALCGIMDLTGEPDREPLMVGASLMSYVAGQTACYATLAAHYHQVLRGQGQHVEVSLLEAATAVMEHSPVAWTYLGFERKRTGNWGGQAAWGIYPCADGYAGIISGLGDTYGRFLQFIGPPLTDERFASMHARVLHADEINAVLMEWLAGRSKLEVYRAAQQERLPFSYVCDAKDVLESEQLRAREYFAFIDHPYAGTLPYAGPPFRMSACPWEAKRAPLLGEHNEAVLMGELGLSAGELARAGAAR